jgi:hypothetical protein
MINHVKPGEYPTAKDYNKIVDSADDSTIPHVKPGELPLAKDYNKLVDYANKKS